MRRAPAAEHIPAASDTGGSDGATPTDPSFWRARLAGLGEPAGFPADLRPAAGTRPVPGTHEVRVPAELAARLDRVSRGRDVALHVVLCAGVIALLGRYHQHDGDVAIGQPTQSAGTPRPNRTLVLRARPSETFRALIDEVGEMVRSAVAHQHVPVAPADPSPVQVVVEFAGLHDTTPSDPDTTPMRFAASREETGLVVTVHHDQARFTRAAVESIVGHLLRLLDEATAAPDQPLAELDLCTDVDRRLVASRNATDRDFDQTATVHGRFAEQVARTPHRPALVTAGTSVSFAELDAMANQLAGLLRARGVTVGEPVAVVAHRSVPMVAAILAVLKAGGAYLPVDPSYPQARVSYILADSGARLALAGRGLLDTGDAIDVVDLDDPATFQGPTTAPEPTAGADDLAYVMYTSGSTGHPKGVQIEHRSVVNRMSWVQRAYPIGPDDVVLQNTSISFDFSVPELFWGAWSGAALALPEPGAERDLDLVVAAVERHQVTTVHVVPSMLTLFLGHVERFGGAARVASLRTVLSIGEPLGTHHVARCEAVLPGVRLVNLYGPTEATIDVTHQPCDQLGERSVVPIGVPTDNNRAHVLDQWGRQCPVGIPGELYLAGAGLARGYLGRDELTRERFVDGAHVGEARLYRTGDLARWLPDGTLDCLGRVDRQVKIRGHRVEPGEVETRLRSHPAVDDVAVVTHDDGWQVALHAHVVARGRCDDAELVAHVRETLPEYMVPTRIHWCDALPLTPNGKLDRAALGPPASPAEAAADNGGHTPPRTEDERVLAGIWREVLGTDMVGVHDNFFALGGNSISFVSVLAKARAAGLNFTFQQLFTHQTIAALAANMAEVASGAPVTPDVADRPAFAPFELLAPEDRAAIPDGVEDAYPLSLLQAGLIFQTEITGALGQYHDVLSYVTRGRFDEAAFRRALRGLVDRHPILRTTYHLTGHRDFLQMVHEHMVEPLRVDDLRGMSGAEQDRWHERWRADEKARRFDWAGGERPIGLHVQVRTDDEYLFTISQHNSALDGWSISLLYTDLFELYYALRDGQEPPRKATSDNHLRNFVGLEIEAMRSAESRDFWLRTARGSTATTVPRRAGATDTADFRVILHDVPLPDGLSDRVIALAESLSVPVKDVLLAAHLKVLSALSGDTEVMTGYEQSGRPELPGAETALGLFLNTVPVRMRLVDGTWAELVRQAYQAEIELLPHRRYPMARMKQDLGTQRTLFETTFNFTHFYQLKRLRDLPEFALVGMRVDSETEFVLRTEFSRNSFDDRVELLLHYHSHLFDAEQIDRVSGYFVEVLEEMTSRSDSPHGAVSLVGDAERQLLRRFSEAARDPGAGSGPQVLDRWGQLAPLGACGDVAVAGRRTGDRGRWRPDGTLDLLSAEAETPAEDSPAAPVVAGSSATMDRIAAVWAEVLGRTTDDIGPSADFFALGGNSLSALRVVLELGGEVTLTDLTTRPRLNELAELVDQRQHSVGLLRQLTDDAAAARCALVCVPYPGGHPINFRPLAESLRDRTGDIAVYAVEQPGHEPSDPSRLARVEEIAERVVAEIEEHADLPIILWGHCGGAPLVVALARLLEEQGFDLRHVFVAGKLLPTIEEMRENADVVRDWSAQDVIRYMVDESGYTELGELGAEHTEHLGRTFRHDVCDGYRYLIDVSAAPEPKVAAPFTVAVAADDPVLADSADELDRWALLASDLRIHRPSRGGHYFVRTDHDGTAALVERAWTSTTDAEV